MPFSRHGCLGNSFFPPTNSMSGFSKQIWVKEDFYQHFFTLDLNPKVKLNGIMVSEGEL